MNTQMNQIQLKVLAAVQLRSTARYREELKKEPLFNVTLVTDMDKAREVLDDPSKQIDVLVVDNELGDVFEVIKEIRHSYPRLIIVLVDENADFAMPGRADDVSTHPFEYNDLINRIKRLNEDRRLQTLRADALPPVRSFAKSILKATRQKGKQQAAVEAVQELGYDYVAFYAVTPTEPPQMTLIAQVGENDATSSAARKLDYDGNLVGWVAQNGQSRTVSPADELTHPFVKDTRFHSGVCVPVGTSMRFGVIFACKKAEDAISQDDVMMLELVSAQLASALAKENR